MIWNCGSLRIPSVVDRFSVGVHRHPNKTSQFQIRLTRCVKRTPCVTHPQCIVVTDKSVLTQDDDPLH